MVELGGFYLDIIKDRVYTTGADSHPRRSAQSAMYHISEAMVRLLAPILSFTAEEIWVLLPGQREASVFFDQFYNIPVVAEQNIDWSSLIIVREGVSKALEDQRAAGTLGSGLEADVTVYADGAIKAALESVAEELRFVFITSEARVVDAEQKPSDAKEFDGFSVSVTSSNNDKCSRCWHRRPDVGSIAGHESICDRCADNVDGSGEVRRYA